jgi:alginate O-acetyltransferase complex protein AlgI
MNFCSLPFLVLLALTFAAYWRLGTRNQNRLLVLASAVFYGWWDWRFLGLMVVSAVMDFTCGIYLDNESRTARQRKVALAIRDVRQPRAAWFFQVREFLHR